MATDTLIGDNSSCQETGDLFAMDDAIGAEQDALAAWKQIVEAAEDAAGAAERLFEFLRETMSEILASIGAQFEELAQNLQVLRCCTTVVLRSIM